MENLDPPSPPNQGWENGAFWLLRDFILDFTLLAEAFPSCFSALYCHSLRGFGCSRFQKQPKQNASCQNREENGSTTLRNTREKPLLAGYLDLAGGGGGGGDGVCCSILFRPRL